VVDASGGETPQADAAAGTDTAAAPAKPGPEAPTSKKAPAAAAPAAPEPAPAEAKPEEAKPASASRDRSPDKELAREAWRKNAPDISAEAGKATMLIPIKGSIEGATYHVTAKPKSVLITLPKGESMITMPFYNLRREGYRQVWVKKDDGTGVTTIRIVLGDASDPQVEIKEDFVRVVVRRPSAAAPAAEGAVPTAAAPEPAAAPSPSPERD
jgi:hypothetical protein